ncbi:trypsin-like [Haematobia irritans]|uniref:trypsin-like n=1 Tax=Haematobia irritans TaxID=7368 RepID=UPI003F4F6A3C
MVMSGVTYNESIAIVVQPAPAKGNPVKIVILNSIDVVYLSLKKSLKMIKNISLILCTVVLSGLITDIEANTLPLNSTLEETSPSMGAKIVGGSTISINDANYQASLRLVSREKSRGFGYGHVCGGSIITQRIILTAAHCLINANTDPITDRSAGEFRVVVGSANLYKKDANTLEYNVQELAKHNGFSTENLYNDIALIFVNGYIPWNWPTAKAINLNAVAVAENTPCTISGWGKTETSQIPSTLLGATVPIVSYPLCESSYGKIPETMICAGYMATGGIDACQGDSGGPMVCNGKQVGVVSWGVGCGLRNNPGVYTNVSSFIDWITMVNSTFDYSLYRNGGNYLCSSYIRLLIVLSSLLLYYLF